MADEASMLGSCRAALRIADTCTDYDEEIQDLIGAARAKMRAGGLSAAKADDDADPLVRVAIKCFVKSGFGLDNPDSAKYAESFEGLVTQMKATSEYGGAS